MVFLLIPVLLLTAWRFTLIGRRRGFLFVVKSVGAAAVIGLLAGVFIGVGARVGMGAIAVANGLAPSVTLSGSVRVVATFSTFGVVLGVVYEGLLRQPLRRRGPAYGVVLTLCSWYPLAHAASQQLTERPSLTSLVVVSGLMVALMWLPFGVALETLLRRWERRRGAAEVASAAA